MDIIDSAMDTLKSGVSAARGAVSGVAVEQLAFVRGFCRLCDDGWQQGWHERNGGNLTYRMKEEEVEQARPFFDATPGEWVNMGVQADSLRGAFFLTTGSGRYMRNVMNDPSHNIGIVEINDAGDSWRIVWGLTDGGKRLQIRLRTAARILNRIAALGGSYRADQRRTRKQQSC